MSTSEEVWSITPVGEAEQRLAMDTHIPMEGIGVQVDQREALEGIQTHISEDHTHGLRLLCLGT